MATTLKFLAAISFVLALSDAAGAVGRQISYGLSMAERYEQWMAQYGRVYNEPAEKDRRFKIFSANVEYIDSFNAAGTHKYKLGVNQFADLTLEEMKTYTGVEPPTTTVTNATAAFSHGNLDDMPPDIPPEMDWRDQGAVTPVKQQGRCGGCWAFATVAAVEGIVKINTGYLFTLSEQELIDCDTGSSGCKNGKLAFDYIVQNGGIAAERDYPYRGFKSSCKSDILKSAVTIETYVLVPENNETALLQVVSYQPVAVYVDSSSDDFRYYTGGIFAGDCGIAVDHTVTVVGYGTADGDTDYWLIKNSWGTSWGEGGYMRLLRNVASPQGLCGIAMQAMYPKNPNILNRLN